MSEKAATSRKPGRGRLSGLALFTVAFCLLSAAAAAVSFASGSWLGILWILLAGLSSNMAWYYLRRPRREGR